MTTVFTQSISTTDDGGGDGSQTFRMVLAGSLLSSATGNQAQITLTFGNLSSGTQQAIALAYFGQVLASSLYSWTGNQAQVTWNAGQATLNAIQAVGSSGVSIASDVITLGENWDNTKKYGFGFDIANQAVGRLSMGTISLTSANLYFAATSTGINNSSVTTVTLGSVAANSLQFLSQIQITAGSAAIVFDMDQSGMSMTRRISAIAY